MDKRIEATLKNLEKNNIKAIYANGIDEVQNIVKGMLTPNCIITAGGSMSLKESGVWEILKDEKYQFYDRSKQGITPEQQQEAFRMSIGADFFFCSTNAATENGELLNVDGFANRISSIAFGPKKVVLIVGKNKIVKDINEAFLRVKKIAAPKNTVRLNLDTPCARLGHCVSLENSENPCFTDGCSSPDRICISYLTSAFQRVKNRITVILCETDLGY